MADENAQNNGGQEQQQQNQEQQQQNQGGGEGDNKPGGSPEGKLPEFKNEGSRPNENKETQGAEVTYEYTPTGDAGLDLALEFVGNLGFAASHPAMQAAQKGEFGELKSALAAMGDKAKGYERFIAVAENSHKSAIAKAKESQAATVQLVEAAVGGADTWKEVAAFVSQHADENERADIEKAFAAGGTQAKSMAIYLHNCYQNSLGAAQKGKPAANPDKAGGGKAASSNAPLDPRAYAKEMDRMNKETRGSPESHPDYAGLRARALRWQA